MSTSLKQVLFALVTDVAEARSMADHAVVRRAELQRSHPLLASLPTSRMRLSSVKIELPVLIEAHVPSVTGTATDLTSVVDQLWQLLATSAGSLGPELSSTDEEAFRSLMARQLRATRSHVDTLQKAGVRDHSGLRDAYTRAVYATVDEITKDRSRELLGRAASASRSELGHAAASLAVQQAAEPSLSVEVRSDEIKERDPATITRLSITLHEEAVEWTDNDRPRRRLVQE